MGFTASFSHFWINSKSSLEIGISDFVPFRNPKLFSLENNTITFLQSSLYRKDEISFPFISSGLQFLFFKTDKKISLGFGYQYQNDYHQLKLENTKELSIHYLNHLFFISSSFHLKDREFFFSPFIGFELGILTYSSLLTQSIGSPLEKSKYYQRMPLENFSFGVFTGLSLGIRVHLIENILSFRYFFSYQFTTSSTKFLAKEYEILTREIIKPLLEDEFQLNHSGLKMNLNLIFYLN